MKKHIRAPAPVFASLKSWKKHVKKMKKMLQKGLTKPKWNAIITKKNKGESLLVPWLKQKDASFIETVLGCDSLWILRF